MPVTSIIRVCSIGRAVINLQCWRRWIVQRSGISSNTCVPSAMQGCTCIRIHHLRENLNTDTQPHEARSTPCLQAPKNYSRSYDRTMAVSVLYWNCHFQVPVDLFQLEGPWNTPLNEPMCMQTAYIPPNLYVCVGLLSMPQRFLALLWVARCGEVSCPSKLAQQSCLETSQDMFLYRGFEKFSRAVDRK